MLLEHVAVDELAVRRVGVARAREDVVEHGRGGLEPGDHGAADLAVRRVGSVVSGEQVNENAIRMRTRRAANLRDLVPMEP